MKAVDLADSDSGCGVRGGCGVAGIQIACLSSKIQFHDMENIVLVYMYSPMFQG